jgi:Response regulator containing CheY-like receiver, AAA-type ATPase, and DNA-binding domains
VEDVEPCGSTLEIALGALAGVRIVVVYKSDEAWRYLQNDGGTHVCAVVTDLHMPGMDGFELIERVRANSNYDRVPIVVISGSADPQTPSRVAKLGANAFFPKPYSPMEVRAKLEQLLYGTLPHL